MRFRNSDVRASWKEGRFCGHFARFFLAAFRSLQADVVSAALSWRLSRAAKISFPVASRRTNFKEVRCKLILLRLAKTAVSSRMRNYWRNDKLSFLIACHINSRRMSWLEVSKGAIERRRNQKRRRSRPSRWHRVKRVQRQVGSPTRVLTKRNRR